MLTISKRRIIVCIMGRMAARMAIFFSWFWHRIMHVFVQITSPVVLKDRQCWDTDTAKLLGNTTLGALTNKTLQQTVVILSWGLACLETLWQRNLNGWSFLKPEDTFNHSKGALHQFIQMIKRNVFIPNVHTGVARSLSNAFQMWIEIHYPTEK